MSKSASVAKHLQYDGLSPTKPSLYKVRRYAVYNGHWEGALDSTCDKVYTSGKYSGVTKFKVQQSRKYTVAHARTVHSHRDTKWRVLSTKYDFPRVRTGEFGEVQSSLIYIAAKLQSFDCSPDVSHRYLHTCKVDKVSPECLVLEVFARVRESPRGLLATNGSARSLRTKCRRMRCLTVQSIKVLEISPGSKVNEVPCTQCSFVQSYERTILRPCNVREFGQSYKASEYNSAKYSGTKYKGECFGVHRPHATLHQVRTLRTSGHKAFHGY